MISDNARSGMQQAPARSLFNALGFTAEELKKPMVGIVSSYNEIVPGHMNIDKIVNAVKLGVAEAGGVPVVFPAIAVCDGIAMGHVGMKYSLVTRDLIADSTECMAIAHQFDALVMVPNCDKNVPGLLMAAARLNLPTVFVSGGPFSAVAYTVISFFQAVGKPWRSLILALLRKGGLDIPLMFIFFSIAKIENNSIGPDLIVWATPITDIICSLLAVFCFLKNILRRCFSRYMIN